MLVKGVPSDKLWDMFCLHLDRNRPRYNDRILFAGRILVTLEVRYFADPTGSHVSTS